MKKLSIVAIILAQLAACKLGPPDRDNPDDPKASNYANSRTLILSDASALYETRYQLSRYTADLLFE